MQEEKTMTTNAYVTYVDVIKAVDNRVNVLVDILLEKKILTPEEADRVYKLSPFLSPLI